MNAFYEHHKDNIRFAYRCFDRILLNATIQTLQEGYQAMAFFSAWRRIYPLTRKVLRDIAAQYHNWATNRSQKWHVKIEEDPKGRRDDYVERYFHRAEPDQVVTIIKAREPARIVTSIGKDDRWHLELKQRWVEQYNFYVNDRDWGPMFVRVCPYFPFSTRICLNQHYWLANQMRRRSIPFQQCANAFVKCQDPEALQKLADSLTPDDLLRCGQKWLTRLIPFFTHEEWKVLHHRLFFAQVEHSDNLIFKRRAALDALQQRLLDANRSIGHPNKLTTIFGRKITRRYSAKIQTVIHEMHLPNPVIRSHYKNGAVKQYVRDHLLLRTEPTSNNIHADYGIPKAISNLPKLQQNMSGIIDRYLDVQQDILETFVDRGQLRQLNQPTVLPNGKRIPGLRPDHPRQIALMEALVRFSHLVSGGIFTTRELHPETLKTIGATPETYKLGSLRYDLSKLRAKGLVEKLPHSHRYRLLARGYQICLVYLKLFHRLYAPLTAGILAPFPSDRVVSIEKMTELDRLYAAVSKALDNLCEAVGLKAA